MPSRKILTIASSQFELKETLSHELKVSRTLAQILLNRGITNPREAEQFLNAKLEQLLDPNSFSGMQQAVQLIEQAARRKDKVLVYGDYDVDGLTALALVKGTLEKKGIETLHYLPHRIKEGYGLSKDIVGIAKEARAKLLITVDCGISNHKEIAQLRHNGIDVIITDHHEPAGAELPQASSIINPKTSNSTYPFRDLAGVGVAYKLCQALTKSHLHDDLDLVTLGTIADVVPLIGENRIIVKEGLARLTHTKRPGIRALIENAGIEGKKFTSHFVSFILGPRLNASGRMDNAETSLHLLLSETDDEAQKFAQVVEGLNRQRQKIESKIMGEAEDLINREVNFKEHKVIVVAKEDWHQGVLGIVASKLADRFYRPTIVISLTEKLCKGSGRSIKNFHLFHALKECREFLDSFGGHSHAVGLIIDKNNIHEFKESINRLAHEQLKIEDLLPSIAVDAELKLAEVDEKLVEELELLEPYGTGNPEPLFYTRDLKLKGQMQVLGRETIKFWVTDGVSTHQAIGFGMSSLRDSFNQNSTFGMVYTPRMDTWRDNSSLILEVKDIFFN